MQSPPPNNQRLHSDLPEHVPESEVAGFKFSVPDRTAPYVVTHAFPHVGTASPSSSASSDVEQPQTGGRGKRRSWILLLLCAVLLAVISGTIGGFIGQAISNRKHKDAECSASTSPSPSPSPSPTAPTPTSASTSPTATPTLFQRTLAQPSTGCTSATTYNTFKSVTQFLETPYTTLCGQGWLNNELTALSAATPSDCIEACAMYNAHKATSDRECVGGGFIPVWWNQTRAMGESGGMAFNCFLKSNVSGIARNNKAFEVVALCFGGSCDGVAV